MFRLEKSLSFILSLGVANPKGNIAAMEDNEAAAMEGNVAPNTPDPDVAVAIMVLKR